MRYINPRKAQWPRVHFIVGNPPFIGKLKMKEALGDGYVDALRKAWPEVPDSADLVMYWWQKAAETVCSDSAQCFGLITTNSLTMIFNRRVIEAHQNSSSPLSLVYAIPDHPWVDNAGGAAVRIAMTVGKKGTHIGQLLKVAQESAGESGEVSVKLSTHYGKLHADLTIGANVTSSKALLSNLKLSNTGVIPHGAGMLLNLAELATIEVNAPTRPYLNGKDLTNKSRQLYVIDCYGLSEVMTRYPKLYQWLLNRVKPERDVNPDKDLREKWWLHRRNNDDMRRALAGLKRYVVTVMTAKHRVFQFIDGSVLPDQMLVTVATEKAIWLGVLSSQMHVQWALATGGRLGVGNDPRYNKSKCFETFPFPTKDTGLTLGLTERISQLAEQIDAHRKTQQAAHPDLTLTGMYNVLEKLRNGEALSAKDKTLHEQGLVSVLRTLHYELDAAVLQAYGWSDLGPAPCGQDEASTAARETWSDALLQRLVDLNTRRAAEEANGTIRWLRPEFQKPTAPTQTTVAEQTAMDLDTAETATEESEDKASVNSSQTKAASQQAWPNTLPEQIKAVADVLSTAPTALDMDAIAAHFKGRGRWRERLPMILETLVAIGRLRKVDDRCWGN
jgi:hypothetical protein